MRPIASNVIKHFLIFILQVTKSAELFQVRYSSLQSCDNFGPSVKYFYKKKLEDISPFVGPQIPFLWTPGDIYSGFQSQSGQPLFAHVKGVHVTCSLRFTSGATPTDLLATNIAAKLISSTYL